MGIFSDLLSLLSGGKGEVEVSEQLLFDKVIGFKGITDGCGASTLVQNVAAALSDATKYKICVVDTNMIYPCQHALLGGVEVHDDILDFARGKNFGEIVSATTINNVYTVGFLDRTIIDLVAVTEDAGTFDKLLEELKIFYDIILIDLSHEPSNFAVQAAIKCNKIFMVCDTSAKAISNIVKAYNYLTTLGVSLTKCKRIILNKAINVSSGVNSIFEQLKLEKFGEIPFSDVIYKQGVSGKPFYNIASMDAGVTQAHILLDKLVKDIVEESPKNDKKLKKVKKTEAKVQEIDFSEDDNTGNTENEVDNSKQMAVPMVYKKTDETDMDEPVFSGGGDK